METALQPTEYLKRKLTFEDVESEMHQQAVEYGLSLSPRWLQQWAIFKTQFVDGDELWYWEYFPEAMTGAAGYCIVRNGKSIASITTLRA